jgi:hypothetical protein
MNTFEDLIFALKAEGVELSECDYLTRANEVRVSALRGVYLKKRNGHVTITVSPSVVGHAACTKMLKENSWRDMTFTNYEAAFWFVMYIYRANIELAPANILR